MNHFVSEFGPLISKLDGLPSRFAWAIIILIVFWIFNIVIRWVLRNALLRAHVHSSLVSILIDNVLWLLIWFFAIIVSANMLDLNLTTTLTGLGFLGVALGFAAQDSIGNIISGMLIFWDKPFQVGEWIEVDEKYGQVKEITVRTTRIRTLNNTYVIIPNLKIINSSIINHSVHGNTRISISVLLSYHTDMEHARQVLVRAAKLVEGVLPDPHPEVVASALDESGIRLKVRVWLDDMANEQRITQKLYEACKNALDHAGIEIPYPHRTIIMHEKK